MPGCKIWIAADLGFSLPMNPLGWGSSGSAVLDLFIPSTPALRGARLAGQAVELDGSRPAGIGAVSNAGVAILF